MPEQDGSGDISWLESSAEGNDETEPDTAAGVTFLRSLVLPDGTKLTNEVVMGEAAHASALLASGWSEKELADVITDGTGIRVQSWVALLRSKIRKQKPKHPQQHATNASPPSVWPDWCGACDREERRYPNEDGRLRKCPTCNPRSPHYQTNAQRDVA